MLAFAFSATTQTDSVLRLGTKPMATSLGKDAPAWHVFVPHPEWTSYGLYNL